MRTIGLDIAGLGIATVDIMTLVPRLPCRDEVFRARSILLAGGGSVVTTSVAASRPGAASADRIGRHGPAGGPGAYRAGEEG